VSASSGWDYPPPTPEPARTPLDNGSEPVGYNLEDTRFQQPPMHPYGYPVAPLPTGQATAGFVLSLVGFLTGWVLPCGHGAGDGRRTGAERSRAEAVPRGSRW